MRDMKQQLAVVTGAAGGIGVAIVDELLSRGCRVIGWDLDMAALANHPAIGEKQLQLRAVDVTNTASLVEAIAHAEAHEGGISILINNAGANGPTVPVGDYQRGDWDRILALNLTAVFEICKRVAPVMAQRGYGRIVNVSSVVGVRGIADACAYSASKAGVIGFTMGLAKELIRTGVTANCVAPALIETALLEQMTDEYASAARNRIPMGRAGTTAEVAATIGWISSPACSFTTGSVFDVSGGRLAW